MRYILLLAALIAGSLAPVNTQTFEEDVRQLERMSDTFAKVSARVQAGVVAVSTERIIESASPFRGLPFEDPIFRRFFRVPQRQRERRGHN